jgi:hypothetical protein
MLVFGGVHVVSELIGGLPELGFKTQRGIVGRFWGALSCHESCPPLQSARRLSSDSSGRIQNGPDIYDNYVTLQEVLKTGEKTHENQRGFGYFVGLFLNVFW